MIFYCFIFLFFQNTFSSSISFLNKNAIDFIDFSQKIDFWHLDFFKQTKPPILTGKNTVIAILDSRIGQLNSNCNNLLNSESNITLNEFFDNFDIDAQSAKKHLPRKMKKIDLSKEFFQKNHGNCTLSIIKQLVPQAIIIYIPVLNDRGYADKEEVYQALKLAKIYNPDILHLGFQILDFDLQHKVDKKICKLLKRFAFVVIPIGNNIKSDFPPKLPNVFSVASFSKKDNGYPISEFCQNINSADFIMPGEDIWVIVYDFKTKNYRRLSVSGTSFSASLMTSFIALLIEKSNKKRSKIKENLLKLSTFLEDSWKGTIRYGFPHF